MNKLVTIGAMGLTGIASAAVFAFPMGSAVAGVGNDAGTSARHGHHEPGDDHGHHGHHHEPGDDHGHHGGGHHRG
jgi:hypothetical protein